jgi:hypothetical protein
MCTEKEKLQMIRFVADQLHVTEDAVSEALAIAMEKVNADGQCAINLRRDQLFEEVCANAILVGMPSGGERVALATEASLACIGMFTPTPNPGFSG